MNRLRLLTVCWLSLVFYNAPVAACTADLDADADVDVVEIVELLSCALGEGDAGELCIQADVAMVVSASFTVTALFPQSHAATLHAQGWYAGGECFAE